MARVSDIRLVTPISTLTLCQEQEHLESDHLHCLYVCPLVLSHTTHGLPRLMTYGTLMSSHRR